MEYNRIKIGITGGIGSGKSVVCDHFASKGYPVINADDVAKKVLVENDEVRAKVIKRFGKKAYDGKELNRAYLAERVFSKPDAVEQMNSIVHPPTIRKIKSLQRTLLNKSKIVFVEAPLIYEAHIENLFDFVIVVSCSDDVKIDRVINRDKVDKDSILKRMENQMPDDEKKDLADFVIVNDATIDELKSKSDFILTLISSMLK